MVKKLPPPHPGEILKEEFLKPNGITEYRLAKEIKVPPRRINEIIHGQRGITADTALRLGRFFEISAQFWMNLQAHYDLEKGKEAIEKILKTEIKTFSREDEIIKENAPMILKSLKHYLENPENIHEIITSD